MVVLAGVAANDYASAKQKIDLIQNDRLKPGARVDLTTQELLAYFSRDFPNGVRDGKLEVTAPEIATGSAFVDFGKVRRAQGHPPGFLTSWFLDGERFVKVTARIRSSKGTAVVDVQRVQISGIQIDGGTLDFLIDNVLLTLYPEAAVGRPFQLGHRIEKIDVQPKAVGVVIGK